MINERQQELASLYALDLLAGTERVEFEAELASNPELQTFVHELREASSKMAYGAPPATPPDELRQRILDSIDQRTAASETSSGRITPFSWGSVISWAIAAGFALSTLLLGSRYFLVQTENERLANERTLTALALKSADTQLDAERLTSTHLASAFAGMQLAAKRQLAGAENARASIAGELAETRQDRTRLVAALAQAEKSVAQARSEIAALDLRRQRENGLANLKIATLASMLHNSPKALAVAVWNSELQEGVFTVDQLAATNDDQRYELWLIDGAPVSAGVFQVGPDGRARLQFKPIHAVQSVAKFAVSREKNDGLKAHAAPTEVVMISQ